MPTIVTTPVSQANPEGPSYALQIESNAGHPLQFNFLQPNESWLISFWMQSTADSFYVACTYGSESLATQASPTWQQVKLTGIGTFGIEVNGSAGQTIVITNLQIGPWPINLKRWFHHQSDALASWVEKPQFQSLDAAPDGTVMGIDTGGNVLQAVPSAPWLETGGIPSEGFVNMTAGSDGSLWAIDPNSTLFRFERDLDSWTKECDWEFDDLGGLVQIAVIGPQKVWAVHKSGSVYQYMAPSESWAPQTVGTLSAIAASTDGTVWGIAAGQVVQFNETAFEPVSPQPAGTASSIAMGGADWVFAITSSGIFQYDGDGQVWEPLPNDANEDLSTLYCGNDGLLCALSSATPPQLYRFDLDAQAWTQFDPLPGGASIQLVAAGDFLDLWAVGGDQLFRFAAGEYQWSTVATSTPLTVISVGGASNIWGRTATDGVYQISPSGTLTPIVGSLQGIAAGDDDTAWGLEGGVLVTYDSSNPQAPWKPMYANGNITPLEISAGNTQTIWAVDGTGVAYRYTPAGAAPWTAAGGNGLRHISAASDGSACGVDGQSAGYVCSPDSHYWQPIAGKWQGISAAALNYVWGITSDGKAHALASGGNPFGEGIESTTPAQSGGLATRITGRQLGPLTPMFETESVFNEAQSTHLWIVNRAAKLAGQQGDEGKTILGKILPVLGQKHSAFSSQVCQGLYDADFELPYNGPKVHHTTFRYYEAHFYDPVSGKSYRGKRSFTALSQGRLYFWRAVANLRKGDASQAGYNLGLALHFFTDLTQPMHSLNFTYTDSSPDWGYHTEFESYVMKEQSKSQSAADTLAYSPTQGIGDLPAPVVGADPGEYLRIAAVCSGAHRLAVCGPSLTEHFTRTITGSLNRWARSMVQPYVEPILLASIKATAPFLVNWMTLADSASALAFLVEFSRAWVVDVPNSSEDVGQQLSVYQWNGSDAQRLTIAPVSNTDYFIIGCLCNGWVLDVVDVNAGYRADAVIQNIYTGADSQCWTFNADGTISNKTRFGFVLMEAAGAGGGGSVLKMAQVSSLNTGNSIWLRTGSPSMMVLASSNGLAADITNAGGAGTGLQVFTPQKAGHPAQTFLWAPLVGADSGYFMILTAASEGSFVLQATGDGQQVIQTPWTQNDSMKWKQVPVASSPFIMIQNKGTNGFLIVQNPSANALVITGPSATGSGSQWSLKAVG